MPQQGWSRKREKQYEDIKDSLEERGRKEKTAKEIAARTVNKARARAGESRQASTTSTDDISSGRRGGLRSHEGPGGRTKAQLYAEARKKNIAGRSTMTKAELEKAVGRLTVADPHFVVQHHLATADHYDFRLEIDAVLVSWAVPKGPSTDPRERRMAKRVGDHDLDYELFEGVLSHERRGGGIVQVWDHGTYRNVSSDKGHELTAGQALARGHLSIVLSGEKIRGGYSLIKTRGDDLWLLIKKKGDEGADARRNPTATETRSVLTGRTLDEIEADG